MFLDTGISQIINFLSTDITHGALGTDNTTSTPSDTALGAEVSATVTTVTNEVSGKQLTTTFTKPSTVSSGTTFKEYTMRDSSSGTGNHYIRFVIPATAATTSEDWTIKTRFTVETI